MKGRTTLIALLDSLPSSGEWSPSSRERWLRAMTTMIDLFVEVKEPVAELPAGGER